MIIGVTGPIGSGTDSFGKILVEKGFVRFSLSDYLREEMKKQGIEINRKNMQDFADKLRKEEGAGVLVKRAFQLLGMKKDYVIESIRNPGEVEELKKINNFYLVLVDAPLKIRFDRILKRERDKDDPRTLEEFRQLEQKDIGIGQPEHGQQHSAVFKMADNEIANDGSFEELKEKTERLLDELKKQNP